MAFNCSVKRCFSSSLKASLASCATCSTCASEIMLGTPQALQWLHGGILRQQFLDAVVAKAHREFELLALVLALLHHTTAKVLVEYLGPHRIGRRRGGAAAG